MNKNAKIWLKAGAVSAAVLGAGVAVAGTGGTEFSTALTTVQDWVEGGLGKLMAVATLSVGLAIGIIQQTVMAVVVAIAMSLALFYGPSILVNLVSGSLPV